MLEPGSQILYGDTSLEPGMNGDHFYRTKVVYLYNRILLRLQEE